MSALPLSAGVLEGFDLRPCLTHCAHRGSLPEALLEPVGWSPPRHRGNGSFSTGLAPGGLPRHPPVSTAAFRSTISGAPDEKCADLVDDSRAITHQSRGRPVQSLQIELPIDFVATKRMLGHRTAAAMASASRKSFPCSFRYGFAYRVGSASRRGQRQVLVGRGARSNEASNQSGTMVGSSIVLRLCPRQLLPPHNRTPRVHAEHMECVLANVDAHVRDNAFGGIRIHSSCSFQYA